MTKVKRKGKVCKRSLKKLVIVGIIVFLVIRYICPFFEEGELFREGWDNYVNDGELDYDEVSSLNYDGTIRERLNELSKQDDRIIEVLHNYDNYPEDLLDMLSRNIEMLDFVMDYLTKKGKVYANTVGRVNKGEIPLLLQWDERWGYANYGENNIAISGCAPTSLSMVIVGLTGNTSITPYVVSKYAEDNGFYLDGVGTSWSLMSMGSSHFGVKASELALSKANIFNALKKGHPIICSMRRGDFTTVGHFIVLVGIEDGKIRVNDPNSKVRSSILWDYDRLESQIKNLWEFSV